MDVEVIVARYNSIDNNTDYNYNNNQSLYVLQV